MVVEVNHDPPKTLLSTLANGVVVVMKIYKEREERAAFDKEFGVSEINMFASNDENLDQSLVLKCNWLGWKKRAELEYLNNPETIEVSGLDTIKKLCKFADKHDMAGCTFTEIVERMFDELSKEKATPEGFVLVPKVITDEWMAVYVDPEVSKYCKEFEGLPFAVTEKDLPMIQEDFRRPIKAAHSRLMKVIEAQEQSHD